MPSKMLLKTKYEHLFYYKENGINHHFVRFTHGGKTIKRKIAVGLCHKDANRKAVDYRNRLTISFLQVKERTLREAFGSMVKSKEQILNKNYAYLAKCTFTKLEPLADKNMKAITVTELNELTRELLKKFKPAYLYQIHRIIIDTFKHEGLPDLTHSLILPKYDNIRHLNLHIDDARRLYKAIKEYPDPIYRSLFLFGVYGRRKGEASGLKWTDIDIKNRLYTIQPENNKTRTLDIYTLPEEHIKTLQEIKPINEYVHTNLSQNPLYHFRKRWVRMLLDNKIPFVRFHDLRHLLGGIAVNEGYSLEQIGKALGHKRPETTRRYSRLKQEAGYAVTEAVLRKLS